MAERDSGGCFFRETEWRFHGLWRFVAAFACEYKLYDTVPCHWSVVPDAKSRSHGFGQDGAAILCCWSGQEPGRESHAGATGCEIGRRRPKLETAHDEAVGRVATRQERDGQFRSRKSHWRYARSYRCGDRAGHTCPAALLDQSESCDQVRRHQDPAPIRFIQARCCATVQPGHRKPHIELKPIDCDVCDNDPSQNWKRIVRRSPHDTDKHFHVGDHRRVQSHYRRGHSNVMLEVSIQASPHAVFPLWHPTR